MQRIYFNFFGILVLVESRWTEIINLIEKDFSCFLFPDSSQANKPFFSLKIFQEKKTLRDFSGLPEKQASMQTQNSLSYDAKNVRYNDYYGELFSEINFETEEAILFSLNLEKMHEMAYLVLLSRVGKKLDLMGLHKLHAFAISFDDQALVCMMPSRGGKSTLLMELIRDPKVKIISDDIPIINRSGQVLPFPMKVGLDFLPSDLIVINPEENIYEMKRSQFGTKKIISLKGLSHKVENLDKKFSKIILIEAFRYNSEKSVIKKASWFQTSKGLFKHGVIGFGLPMVIEYFWEFGLIDFIKKTIIFFSRSWSFFRFSLRAKKHRLLLGQDPKKAASEILLMLNSTPRKV